MHYPGADPRILSTAVVYRTDETIAGFFDSLFGGLFVVKGIPLLGQLGILAFFCCTAFALWKYHETRRKRWGDAAQLSALVVFTGIFFFLLQPWDELFINLRHSLHFAEDGVFSFNRYRWIEGTVDFLPYLVLGALHRLGLPLVELSFVLGFAGAVACLCAARSFFRAWGLEREVPYLVCALALYPPLCFNSAHGFATAPFAAAVLWAIRLKDRPGGQVLLALLPLIRPEAALLVVLLAWRRPWLLIPFAGLSAWRYLQFGTPVPTPITFKSSLGSVFFFLVGIRNLVADLASGYAIVFVPAIFLLEERPAAARTLAVLFLFSLPYYVSGGDWFPSYWGRYLFPFSLFGAIAFLAAFARKPRWVLFVPVLVLSLWPLSSAAKLAEGVLTHRRILAKLYDKKTGRGHYRIHHLSQLGLHLGRVLEPRDVIASSELATVMFHAKRETLDLLGLANPEIAKAPLRAAPEIFRRFPTESELPYLIFKRLKPGIVERERPAVVYTFDFILRDLVDGVPFEEFDDEKVALALERWEYNLRGLTDPLYGGIGKLLEVGYRPVVVMYQNAFASAYFVSPEIWERHEAKMAALGFRSSRLFAPSSEKRSARP